MNDERNSVPTKRDEDAFTIWANKIIRQHKQIRKAESIVASENDEQMIRLGLAAVALAGMLAHSTRYKPRDGEPNYWHDAIAKEAFEIADAMIRAAKGE